MRTAKINRKYYLHRRIKEFSRLRPRTVYIYFNVYESLSPKNRTYLNELQSVYGYAIQTEIK